MGEIDTKPSIAVLPFVNLSDDKSQEHFADGLTEDIITGLSCDSHLFVIARNSTFAYKGQSPDIRSVGKELGVRYVLEGSIRPLGDRLRINVQLIEAASGAHVWADKIDRPKAEIFDVMDDVVDSLVTTLCSNLGVAEARRAARQRPENLQAWELLVQAEALFYLQPSPETLATAEELARRAGDLEPGYAMSWVFLARLISARIGFGMSANSDKDRDDARALADKAMHLAPHDPVVLGYCGGAFIWTGQTAQAIDCLERSLELNPNHGLFRLFYGSALWADGRPEAAIEQLDLFLRLSPKDPNAGRAYWFYAWCYLTMNDFVKAEEAARKAVKILPGFAGGYISLAASLTAFGHAAESREAIDKLRRLAPYVTPEVYEYFMSHVIRQSEQAEIIITQFNKAWKDAQANQPR